MRLAQNYLDDPNYTWNRAQRLSASMRLAPDAVTDLGEPLNECSTPFGIYEVGTTGSYAM